tara:strand:+ start:778 stop:1812 length:1035 start_codon:yes stop_codon:yes gene_type:complete
MSNARKLADNLPRQGAFANRSVIMNGEFMVDQRNNGAAVIPTSTYYQLTLDRWAAGVSQASKVKYERGGGSVTPPAGFKTYLAMTQNGSTYTPTTNDIFDVAQYIEGYDTAKFDFGTSTAKNLVVSFWARSNVTGTYGIYVTNKAANRIFVNSYTISAANTWEYKTVSITGDTTGTWLTTNDTGLRIGWMLSAGSGRLTSANAWNASADYAVTGQVNLLGTSNGYLYLTGCKLEEDQATPFEHEPYHVSLNKCLRYYFDSNASASKPYIYAKNYQSTHRFYDHFYNVPMRATPSVTTTYTNSAATSAPTEYHANEYHWKAYTTGASDSANSARLLTFQADAELS